MLNILFAASEAYPYIKTGGLADVCGHLPKALAEEGVEVTLTLPAYPKILNNHDSRVIAHVETQLGYALIREVELEDGHFRLLLVDHPLFIKREGNPYVDDEGNSWEDNDIRFGLFSQAVGEMALGHVDLGDKFDVVHCHDWQTGLVPALLSPHEDAPPAIFTIHNIAYQGTFSHETMQRLSLPKELWSMDGIEFHKHVSFIKGGIAFADRITTVSPTYAEEIKTKKFGCGLEGLLQHRSDALSGIINGIDEETWNPRFDVLLPFRYGISSLSKKAINKRFLQTRFQLPVEDDIFLLGNVGRLVEQKGIDIVLKALPSLMEMPIQLIVVGTGDPKFAEALEEAAEEYPQQMAVHIGYDEELAHWIEAGSDAFLMPSRFEPCGLNQMYSQAYGTPPIVSQTGGLVDTVTNATAENCLEQTATGFYLDSLDTNGLVEGVELAVEFYRDLENWQQIQKNGMSRDFSWSKSAKEYIHLYQDVVAHSQAHQLEVMARKIAE